MLLERMIADRHSDWAITVAFYAVLHLLAAQLDRQLHCHSASHMQRGSRLRQLALPPAMVTDYMLLFTDSRRARDDCDPLLIERILPHSLARFDRLRTELCRLLDLPAL